jgi:hypothetical protein
MNDEAKLFINVTLALAGTFSAVVFTLMGSQYLFRYIEDTIKFNRYQEAVKEYRQCAQKYQDEVSIDAYCGESPSSSILI